jgi:hypothetical protein
MTAYRSTFAAALMATAGLACAQGSDSCATPEPISGFGQFSFDTTAATTDGAAECRQAFNDVWYAWTCGPAEAGLVIANTCDGTGLDTVMMVYSDATQCGAPGTLLGCNDDTCGLQSQVAFVAQAGTTYLIRLGSFTDGDTSTGTLNVSSGIIGSAVNPSNGHNYILLGGTSWTQANAVAQAMGGNLATINDSEENEWVRANMANFGGQDRRVWIGFNDVASEGSFVWTSGQPVAYTNWNPGEPNNTNGLEHYTELFGSNGLWNDQTDLPAGLTVSGVIEIETSGCPADFNGDNQVDFFDYLDFAQAFANEDPAADFNGDNQVDFFDYLDFAQAFDAGCE